MSNISDTQPVGAVAAPPVCGLCVDGRETAWVGEFLRLLPADLGLSYLIVADHQESAQRLAAELRPQTAMPVEVLAGAVELAADQVFIVPDGYGLRLVGRKAALMPLNGAGRKSPAHAVLRALAQHRHRGLIVILDCGVDDRADIDAIRAAGGFVVRHEPESVIGRAQSAGESGSAANYVAPATRLAGYVAGISANLRANLQREISLHQSQEDLNRAQTVGKIGSWRLDVNRNILTWSEENHRIFGLPVGTEMSYETFLSVVHEDDRAYVDRKWKRALAGEPYDIEHRLRIGDEIRWVRERAELEFDAEGRLLGGFGTTQEITDKKLAQEQLAAAKQRLDAHMENSPLAVIEFNPEFRVLRWSNEAERLFGWSAEEAVGRLIPDLKWVYEDDAERVRQLTEGMINGVRPRTTCTNRNYAKDGRVMVCEWYNSCIYDSHGRLISILSQVFDITDRQRAEDTLRESRADLNRAQAVGKIGSWRLDINRDILTWSEENYRIFGLPPEMQLTYEAFRAAVHEDDLAYVDEKWQRALSGEPYDIEHRIRVDGDVRWVRERAELDFDKAGRLLGGFGTSQDITDRKIAEEAVYESEERYRLLVEQAVDGIFVSDAAGCYQDVNAAGCRMLGYSRQEILERSIADVIVAEEVPRVAGEVARIANGAIVRSEWLFRRKDESTFIGEIVGRQLPDGRLQAILRDITERKRFEDELASTKEQLQFVADNAPVMIARVDADLRYLFVNEGYAQLFGRSTAEVVGRYVWDVLGEAAFDEASPYMALVLSDEPIEYDRNMVTSLGGKLTLHVSYVPEHGADGSVNGFLTAVSDVTERRAAEDRLRTFIEEAPAAIAMLDRDMRYLSASRRWLDDYCPSGVEVIGRSHLDVIPETPQAWKDALRRSLAGEVLRADEDPFPRADGRIQYVRWEVRPWHFANGDIGGITIMADDVTAKVESEQALRHSEERLRIALRGAGGGAWDWDLKTGIAWWSPEMYELWGIAPDTVMVLENSLACIHPHDRERVSRAVDAAMRTGSDYLNEYRVKHPHRGERWMTTFGRIMAGRDGEPERIVGLSFDTTDRKRQMLLIEDLNHRLAAEETKLLAILEATTNGIALIERSGRIRLVNRRFERLFGYSRQELIGQPVEILLPGELRTRHGGHREAFFRSPGVRDMGKGLELLGVRRDGSRFPIEVGLSTVTIDDERMALVTLIDVTAMKQAERQLQTRNNELRAINEELEQYAHIVSHDLKAPLRAIIQLTRFINEDVEEGASHETIREHATKIGVKARRLSDMLSDLLEYSRIGREKRVPERVSTGLMMREITEMIGSKEGFEILADDDLPEFETVRAPLQQVLLNLIDNAVKHNDKKQGWVRVGASRQNGVYVFEIEDNGPGIAPEHFSQIFMPFQKLDMSGDTPGQGMGLAHVKRTVDSVGGTIEVISRGDGAGTTFRFTWPTTPTDLSGN